ncbi:MAG: SRPBCC domain-containing protein [Bacteroidota bacterium]
MKTQDYSVTITVDATTQEAFKGINSITKWWTENMEGRSQKLNDEFTVRFDDIHISTQRLVEVIPNKKVVWLVTDSKLNFVRNKQEWTNTHIHFDIAGEGNKTHITFTHKGLIPQIECYNACSTAWGQYITGSLFQLLTTGKGMPELR